MSSTSPGTLRWWFENRRTGAITVVQFPNWPLWGIGATWLVASVVDPGSGFGRAASWTGTGLWIIWAGDEIARGVNPWRRLLGGVVLAWQVVALIGG